MSDSINQVFLSFKHNNILFFLGGPVATKVFIKKQNSIPNDYSPATNDYLCPKMDHFSLYPLYVNTYNNKPEMKMMQDDQKVVHMGYRWVTNPIQILYRVGYTCGLKMYKPNPISDGLDTRLCSLAKTLDTRRVSTRRVSPDPKTNPIPAGRWLLTAKTEGDNYDFQDPKFHFKEMEPFFILAMCFSFFIFDL